LDLKTKSGIHELGQHHKRRRAQTLRIGKRMGGGKRIVRKKYISVSSGTTRGVR